MLYELIGIKQPQTVNGFQQGPMDGVTMVYTFANTQAPGQKMTQYFENNAHGADLCRVACETLRSRHRSWCWRVSI
jgi:hypothetical protein